MLFGVDRISDFNGLHSRRHDEEVQLYAFDVLALDREDLPDLPLSLRKTNLETLLHGRPDGIFVAPFEQGAIGPDLFRAACNMEPEGIVSMRRDRPYRAGHVPYDNLVELRAAYMPDVARAVSGIPRADPGGWVTPRF